MPNRDAKLSMDAKIYITMALACRERPRDILAELLERFKIEVHRTALAHYDPRFNSKLDPELKSLYERTSREFWSDKEFASFNSLQHRQRLREELYDEAGNNRPLKMQILTEAARDEGGLYSNRREITGADGGPIALGVNVQNAANASPEDMARVLAEFPLGMISESTAVFMITKGFVPAHRIREIEGYENASFIEGEIVFDNSPPAAPPPKLAAHGKPRRPRIKPLKALAAAPGD